MKKNAPKYASVLLAAILLFCALTTGCKSVKTTDRAIMHEEEFGGVYVDLTIEDFNLFGFEYGDAVDVTFSNGYRLTGIPYYNGYYTQTGEPLVVAYPGYPYIKVCINNGDDLYLLAGLNETDTATITRSERGAFADIQSARDIHYRDERERFESDAVFANFRSVQAGNLKENTLYRSASPCDNQHNRAPYVDALCEKAGIRCIVNLADTEEKIRNYIGAEGFDSPYFLSLCNEGDVLLLTLNMNYGSDDFRAKVVNGLIAMTEHEGPYLIHCTEGKDRTGFVCMLLEMLCGASCDEIVSDYMITYDNYYGITKETDPKRYQVIVENVLLPMLNSVIGDDSIDPVTADLSVCAVQFLQNAGMSETQIAALKAALTE